MFRKSFAAAAMACASLMPMAIVLPPPMLAAEAVTPQGKRNRQGADWSGLKGRRLRSRGPQARPKRKTNRVRLSRRTRRKHRRAA